MKVKQLLNSNLLVIAFTQVCHGQSPMDPWSFLNLKQAETIFRVASTDTSNVQIDYNYHPAPFDGGSDVVAQEKVLEEGNYTIVKMKDAENVFVRELWYSKDSLIREFNYKNGKKNGPQYGWHDNGQLYFVKIYNTNNGIHVYFDESGNLTGCHGAMPDHPLMRGIETSYYPNGFLTYKHNREFFADTVVYYFDDGSVKSKGLRAYKGGRLGEWRDYYPNGQLKTLSNWGYEMIDYWKKQGMYSLPNGENWDFERFKTGTWNLYSKEGKLLLERDYKKDEMVAERDHRTEDEKLQYAKEDIIPQAYYGEP